MDTRPESAARDWQPGIVFSANTNRAGRARCVTVPTPQVPTARWKARTAQIVRLVLEQFFQVIRLLGAPWARAFTVALWCGTAVAAIASEIKRLLSAFVGWQNEKLSRKGTMFGLSLLPDLRKWHVTLGALFAVLSL